MLPKFLFADNSQELPDNIFIVHTEQPRFIVQCDIEGFWTNQEVYWLDDKPESDELISELLDQAADFMEMELENQERLYDEEDDDED